MKEMFISLFLFLIYFICCYSYEIKVVDGIDKKGERGPTTGLTYTEPDQISGPEALFILNNHCFLASVDRYEYSVCPFYNITQRRLIGPSATLLGVWGQWLTNDTHQTYDTMVYSNGQTCGRKGRSVTLFLSCGHPSFEIISKSVKESSACEHEITFGIPFSCSLLTKKIYNPHNTNQQTTTTTTTTTTNSIPTDFKKSHSTGPNQYTPPPVDSKQPQYNNQNQNQHSTFSSSLSSTSTSSHPATTITSTTTTDSTSSSSSSSSTSSTSSSQTTKSLISDPTLLSLKQQILELQHTIEHLLSSTTSTTSSSQSSSDLISSTNPTTSHDNSSN